MDPSKNALERAFDLARSGKCASLKDIKMRLASEGYSLKDFVGSPSPARQLRTIIETAKSGREQMARPNG